MHIHTYTCTCTRIHIFRYLLRVCFGFSCALCSLWFRFTTCRALMYLIMSYFMCSYNNENNNNYRVCRTRVVGLKVTYRLLVSAILPKWRTQILKAFFACTGRSCRQLAQHTHTHMHTYKSDNLIYHCTLSGTETEAVHTYIQTYICM